MLSQLREIVPAEIIIGGVVWIGFSYVFIAPEVVTRISRAEYHDSCKASVIDIVDQTFAAAELNRRGAAAEVESRKEGARLLNNLSATFPEQARVMDMITGGMWGYAMQQQHRLAARAEETKLRADALLQNRREAALATAPDQCSCQVEAAFQQSRNEWTIFAASLGLVRPGNVKEFPSLMNANAKACAERMLQ